MNTPEIHDHAEGVEPLAPACQILLSRLPQGMILRVLGSAPGDRKALLDHWLGLEPDGLFTRFFHSPSDDALRRRVAEMRLDDPRQAGIFDADGRLVCVAQWANEGGGVAELAFSTLPGHRKLGLAKIASGACAIDARERGFQRMRIDTLRKNKPGRKLCESLGGEIEPSDEPFSESVIAYLDLRSAPKATFPPSLSPIEMGIAEMPIRSFGS